MDELLKVGGTELDRLLVGTVEEDFLVMRKVPGGVTRGESDRDCDLDKCLWKHAVLFCLGCCNKIQTLLLTICRLGSP